MTQENESIIKTELNSLPEEWEVIELCNAYEFSSKPRNLDISQIEIPFVPMEYIPNKTIFLKQFDLKTRDQFSSGTFFLKEDLLVAKITPSFENGKQCIVSDIPTDFGYATTEVWPIHSKEKSDILYLYFYLKKRNIRSELAGKMEGSTGRQRVPKNVLKELKIPLPPLQEQKNIVKVLSIIQENIDKTTDLIHASKLLKKSLMKYLFNYGPVPVDEAENIPLKETEMGMIPDEWDLIKIKDLSEKTPGCNPKKTSNLIFKYVDVSSISNDTLKIEKYAEYLGSEAPSRAKRLLKETDVIFATIRPYLKRIAIVPSELDGEVCSTAFCIIRSRNGIVDPNYIFYTVSQDNFVSRISKHQRGSSYPAVSNNDILNEEIPVPPFEVQVEIANILSSLDRKIDADRSKKKALNELFNTLLNDLMTAKIRVNDLNLRIDYERD